MRIEQLIEDLWDDLAALRAGKIDVQQARARAALGRTMVEAKKVELIEERFRFQGIPKLKDLSPKGRRLS